MEGCFFDFAYIRDELILILLTLLLTTPGEVAGASAPLPEGPAAPPPPHQVPAAGLREPAPLGGLLLRSLPAALLRPGVRHQDVLRRAVLPYDRHLPGLHSLRGGGVPPQARRHGRLLLRGRQGGAQDLPQAEPAHPAVQA